MIKCIMWLGAASGEAAGDRQRTAVDEQRGSGTKNKFATYTAVAALSLGFSGMPHAGAVIPVTGECPLKP